MSYGKKYRYINDAYRRGFKRGAKIYGALGLVLGALFTFIFTKFL